MIVIVILSVLTAARWWTRRGCIYIWNKSGIHRVCVFDTAMSLNHSSVGSVGGRWGEILIRYILIVSGQTGGLRCSRCATCLMMKHGLVVSVFCSVLFSTHDWIAVLVSRGLRLSLYLQLASSLLLLCIVGIPTFLFHAIPNSHLPAKLESPCLPKTTPNAKPSQKRATHHPASNSNNLEQ